MLTIRVLALTTAAVLGAVVVVLGALVGLAITAPPGVPQLGLTIAAAVALRPTPQPAPVAIGVADELLLYRLLVREVPV